MILQYKVRRKLFCEYTANVESTYHTRLARKRGQWSVSQHRASLVGEAAGSMMYQTQWSIQGGGAWIVQNMNKEHRTQMERTGGGYETGSLSSVNPLSTKSHEEKVWVFFFFFLT